MLKSVSKSRTYRVKEGAKRSPAEKKGKENEHRIY
nr:MAG TPA: hypothetical protein [Caudoviricetes sp.]